MNANIFKHELRSLRFVLLANVIKILVFLLIFSVAFFFLDRNSQSIIESLDKVPLETLNLLGINSQSFVTPLGFYTFTFTYMTILATFFSSVLGLKIITAEYTNNTIMFLLTKPIKRRIILKSKNMAALTILGIYHLVFQLATIGIFIFFDGFNNLYILVTLNFALLLIQITLFYISLIIASYVKQPKMVLLTSVFLIIAFFIMLFIENQLNLTFLKFINPFSFFSASDVIENQGIQFDLILNTVFIVVFSINFAYGSYENDDLL